MTDEHSIAIVSFEGAVKRKVRAVRDKLAQLQEIGEDKSFDLTIDVSGRTDGDLKIEYRLEGIAYGSTSVKGNSIDEVVEEYLRRKGWNKTHQVLALPKAEVDEIPF